MSVRYKQKKRCANCPETPEGIPAETPVPPATYEGEGAALWKAALVTCGTLMELLFRYVSLRVPGDPTPQMKRLRQRLSEIIKAREEQNDVQDISSSNPADRFPFNPSDSETSRRVHAERDTGGSEPISTVFLHTP